MNFDEIYSWVKDLPIIDWHNHLDVGAIAADKPFGSLCSPEHYDAASRSGRSTRSG